MREYGKGNTPLWKHPRYLRSTIHFAQEILRDERGIPSDAD
jgi:hypothetical protein